MSLRRSLIIAALLLGGMPLPATAQTAPQLTTKDTTEEGDDLMSILEDEQGKSGKEYVAATFKATRIINGQSIENVGKGILDFRISHRFGTLNQGAIDFFGLDNATTRIGFDYGINSWLMVGIGRSSFNKEYDGFLKAKILRQTTDNSMPFSLSYTGSVMIRSEKIQLADSNAKYYFSNRVSFSNQVLIARKFSDRLSLQLSPTYIHYNLVDLTAEPNDLFALGFGGRLKLNQRISLTAEYFLRLGGLNRVAKAGSTDTHLTYVSDNEDIYHNSLSVGIDIETGGHVFQLHFTNSTGMSERSFVGRTNGKWDAGDIHFGFNISRVFTVVRPKEFKGSRNRIY